MHILLYIHVAPSRDTLYSGMMYYEKKEVGHWKTMYSVVRDLEVLKRVMDTRCTYTCIRILLLMYFYVSVAFRKQALIKY